MTNGNSIINLGDLSKPANTLIEKISDAIGGIFKPLQIRRIAQAEAQADKIQAVAQIEISELQHRALQRFLLEEAKKQNNIESITQKALPSISDHATPQNIEDDWITHFFDKCRLISDEQMQSLWSKILAGEANTPGRYSKRTVDIVSSLDKSDAELFSNLCCFGIQGQGLFPITPLVYDPDDNIYKDRHINFGMLTHLDSIGLIQFDNIGGFVHREPEQKVQIQYDTERIWIEFKPSEKYEMQMGTVVLTKVGFQLSELCDVKPVDGFVAYLKEKWKSFGYTVVES